MPTEVKIELRDQIRATERNLKTMLTLSRAQRELNALGIDSYATVGQNGFALHVAGRHLVTFSDDALHIDGGPSFVTVDALVEAILDFESDHGVDGGDPGCPTV